MGFAVRPMPRPYSVDQRALLACEDGADGGIQVARRLRIGSSTLHLWRKQARDEERHAPKPLRRSPAPLGGGLDALNVLVAERRDAAPAEPAVLLATCTGEKRSPAMICWTLMRSGWMRRQRRCGTPERSAFAAETLRTW